jgi:hypothetical protein
MFKLRHRPGSIFGVPQTSKLEQQLVPILYVQRLRLLKYREDGLSLRGIMLKLGDDLSLSRDVALADLHKPFGFCQTVHNRFAV